MHVTVPGWVPLLFIVLVALGWRQSRPRSVRPATVVALAVGMLGFSVVGIVGAFGASPLALTAWALGYLGVIGLGTRVVGTAGMSATGSFVRVPGSWAPLGLMLGIFAVKFVLGWATGIHAAFVASAWFIGAASFCLGALGGGFGARALAVHRMAVGAGQPRAPTGVAEAGA